MTEDTSRNHEPDEPGEESESGMIDGPAMHEFFAGLDKTTLPEVDGSNPDPSI
jgi:hypothetical protein